jgi:hypothetical protein
MRSTPILAFGLLALLAAPALAQAPPASRMFVRGTVEKLAGDNLTVKSRDGQDLSITLKPNFPVRAVVAKSLSDIKAGDYVASTSLRQPDGSLKAIEVHFFPESMRGTAEGQFPWDLAPHSLMTNATVAQVATAPQGRIIKVTYKGKESEIMVPSGIPIVGYAPGDANLLQPGAAVFLVAQKKPDGSLAAAGVTAEKDGVKPPM